MERITADQVVKAFNATGLKPKKGHFFWTDYKEGESVKCACGLGAVYMHENGKSSNDDQEIADYFSDKVGFGYRVGFVNGFDGEGNALLYNPKWKEEFDKGYEDGKAAREAVFKEE